MSERPRFDKNLDSKIFKNYYFKDKIARKNNLQITGRKLELAKTVVNFLDTGNWAYKAHTIRKDKIIDDITLDTIIEENFVCSKKHRAFYKEQIEIVFI